MLLKVENYKSFTYCVRHAAPVATLSLHYISIPSSVSENTGANMQTRDHNVCEWWSSVCVS
jgi:hypothetical protein